jgi:AraC-like DNA-binding protein
VWPQRWAGSACVPRLVRMQHARPPSTAVHEEVFGCPVEFGAPANMVVYAPEVWELPLGTADLALADYLEVAASEESRRVVATDPVLGRLEQTLADRLPSGDVGVVRVARAMGMSPRSLHRRLQERGVTWRDVLDGVRRRVAQELLRRHTVAEVAFLVGFSDPSGFRRAYRRWTGVGLSPRAGPAGGS